MVLRTDRKTNHDVIRTVALAVTALVLFSCQNDDILDNSHNDKVTVYPIISSAVETTPQTRALQGNYTEFTVNQQVLSTNAVAFDSDDERVEEEDISGIFAPVSTGWRSTVEVKPSYKYNLYSYSRIMPTATAPVFNYGSESSVSLTFTGLDIITENDPLVGIAAAAAAVPDNQSGQYPVLNNLNRGKFSIGMVPSSELEGSTFKAFLALDHLYSKATISFCVAAKYNGLREIHIKDVQIKVDHNTLSGSHVYRFYTQQFELEKDNNNKYVINGNPASIDLFDGPTATAQPEEGDDFIALTTQYQEFGYYYFLPLSPTPSMYLEVTYDILDLQNNTVRRNQTARNGNLFQSISDNGGKATAGRNYNVNITVDPTYVFQLSDGDLNSEVDL